MAPSAGSQLKTCFLPSYLLTPRRYIRESQYITIWSHRDYSLLDWPDLLREKETYFLCSSSKARRETLPSHPQLTSIPVLAFPTISIIWYGTLPWPHKSPGSCCSDIETFVGALDHKEPLDGQITSPTPAAALLCACSDIVPSILVNSIRRFPDEVTTVPRKPPQSRWIGSGGKLLI